MSLKWGIAASGKIAHDFTVALSTLSDLEHEVVAVAARDPSKSQAFATLHNIPKSYAGYAELASDPDVEVVYVATINPYHYDVAQLMLEHGKHVLVEKPLCMNERESRKLIMYAERKKLFLMEAIWSRFFPSYEYLRRLIRTDVLGDIRSVHIEMGFDIKDVDRIQKKELGGGTILDLGVYPIQLCSWIFDIPPKSITAHGELNDDGVDLNMEAELSYGDKVSATIMVSAIKELSNKAVVVGTKGQLTLNNFWCPTTIIDIDGSEKIWPLVEANKKFHFTNSAGLRYEADEVRRCIRAKLTQSESCKHNDSLIIAHIEDEIRKQLGVKYEQDS